jgi:hypothetical protein
MIKYGWMFGAVASLAVACGGQDASSSVTDEQAASVGQDHRTERKKCNPREVECACATGVYCVQFGQMCINPASPCP